MSDDSSQSHSQLVEEIPDTCDSTEESNENVFNILIATDIHLGYNEKDPTCGNDSFNTFEEILQNASASKVDFVLLGGDLFHDSKPSTTCYHRCITLLKRYCLGDRPVALQFLSDPSQNFTHLKNPVVNYEDPNLNIELPVFSIHGNHDDATGENHLSAMDILADTGLVNYFGKWSSLTQVELYPILIQKGDSKLALYGLSHIKDERLCRLFKDKKVKMVRPRDADNWFNILVLHQNRAQNRGRKNFIPESVLPEFVDLVVWGHEHDCRIDPEDTVNGPYVVQPGSSVATSLAQGEALEKYVALVRIKKTKFCLDKIKLNTVRPFVFRELDIPRPDLYDEMVISEYAKNQIFKVIEEMLRDVEKLKTPKSPQPPLLRLVVQLGHEDMMFNSIRLGQTFRDKVANPEEMFLLKVRKPVRGPRAKKQGDLEPLDMDEVTEGNLEETIGDLVDIFFERRGQCLNLLSTRGLSEAVARYIERNDTDAIDDIVNHQMGKTLDRLTQLEDCTQEEFQEYLDQFREERKQNEEREMKEINEFLGDEKRLLSARKKSVDNDGDLDSVDISSGDEDNLATAGMSMKMDTTKGRPPRGRGSRGPRRSRARGRAK